MSRFFSFFPALRKRRKRTAEDRASSPKIIADKQPEHLPFPETGSGTGERLPEKQTGSVPREPAKAPEAKNAGPVPGVPQEAEGPDDLTEEAAPLAEAPDPETSVSPGFRAEAGFHADPEEEPPSRPYRNEGAEKGDIRRKRHPVLFPGMPEGERVLENGEEALFSLEPVHSGIHDADSLLRRGGFAGETPAAGEDPSPETFRLLLDRAEETKEILSRLNETADEIRRELTT